MTDDEVDIAFVCVGLDDDAQPLLHGVDGREEISRAFAYRLLLSRADPFTQDELDTLLNSHAAITMGRGDGDMVFGCLQSIELLDHTFGEHFKTQAEGNATAKVRAEFHSAQRRIFSGRTDCARFRVGHTFDLDNHHDAQHDGKYLITSMNHRVGAPFPMIDDFDVPALAMEWHRYRGHFTCIPASVPFRAERRTPWPRIEGIMHAHIAGDTAGTHAELDDSGRYRVQAH